MMLLDGEAKFKKKKENGRKGVCVCVCVRRKRDLVHKESIHVLSGCGWADWARGVGKEMEYYVNVYLFELNWVK